MENKLIQLSILQLGFPCKATKIDDAELLNMLFK